jgi:hypothetical protein
MRKEKKMDRDKKGENIMRTTQDNQLS